MVDFQFFEKFETYWKPRILHHNSCNKGDEWKTIIKKQANYKFEKIIILSRFYSKYIDIDNYRLKNVCFFFLNFNLF